MSLDDEVVDLNASPPLTPLEPSTPSTDPLSSVSAVASYIDAHPSDTSSLLNELLLPYTDLSSLDKALGSLSTRLSLLSSDTSSELEESIHDISRAVPRLTYDLQFMRESATTLQSSLGIVQAQVAQQRPSDTDGDETYKSLEKLAHLDKLKTRMESARGILREAESWSTLEGEITEFIGSESWEKAGVRLAEASKSMVVFQSTPGEYESRRTLLVSLQNELEGRLATALEGAIEKDDVAACGKLREVFEMIERGQEFQRSYFAAKRRKVLEEWTDLESGRSLSTFLSKWFASLLATTHTEKSQIPLIFTSSPEKVLGSFLHSIMENLSPSFESRLFTVANDDTAETLPELIKAYKAAEDFASSARGVFGSMVPKANPTLSPKIATVSVPNTPRPRARSLSLARTTSRPKSIASSVEEIDDDTLFSEWEAALFDPFLDFQTAYGGLERRHLVHLMPKSTSTSARALIERATAVFNIAGEAIGRCLSFTHGYGALGLLEALGHFMERFLDALRLDAAEVKQTTDELDFEGLDYSTKDWEGFQHGLHVLAVCRDMRGRLEKLEGRIHETLLASQSELESGPKALLKQSPLNSAELLTLTSSLPLDPPLIALKPARQALRSFTRRTQSFIQSIILAPLKTLLSGYPALPVWSAPEKIRQRGELPVPTFSLGPTETIARVSEGLLNLLRVFEVYAADDALGFSIETLPFVDSDSTGDLNAEMVLSTWVSSLSLSLLAHLTGAVLPSIKNFSNAGAAQLASDLAYLSNAVRALDVEWEELEKWREEVERKHKE